jgi:predicted negative regulator of RcsB-dependent stress response
MSDVPSISIGSITGGQNNIGKTEIAGDQVQNNHYAGEFKSADQVFEKLVEAVPEENREQVEAEVFSPLREEIRTLTAMPIAQAEEQKQSFLDRAKQLVSGLAPYSDKINKVVLNIGEAALSSIAPPVGWFISGTLAAIRSLKE